MSSYTKKIGAQLRGYETLAGLDKKWAKKNKGLIRDLRKVSKFKGRKAKISEAISEIGAEEKQTIGNSAATEKVYKALKGKISKGAVKDVLFRKTKFRSVKEAEKILLGNALLIAWYQFCNAILYYDGGIKEKIYLQAKHQSKTLPKGVIDPFTNKERSGDKIHSRYKSYFRRGDVIKVSVSMGDKKLERSRLNFYNGDDVQNYYKQLRKRIRDKRYSTFMFQKITLTPKGNFVIEFRLEDEGRAAEKPKKVTKTTKPEQPEKPTPQAPAKSVEQLNAEIELEKVKKETAAAESKRMEHQLGLVKELRELGMTKEEIKEILLKGKL